MIPLPSGTKIWLVAGITDMRNGFNGLAAKVQTTLKDDPMYEPPRVSWRVFYL
ncbi:transposase [Escherichia coli]|nr:transposase [Escherichia coli]